MREARPREDTDKTRLRSDLEYKRDVISRARGWVGIGKRPDQGPVLPTLSPPALPSPHPELRPSSTEAAAPAVSVSGECPLGTGDAVTCRDRIWNLLHRGLQPHSRPGRGWIWKEPLARGPTQL